MIVTRTINPTQEPVSVTEVKEHLGVTTFDDDVRLQSLIFTARQLVESYIRRSIMSQTWECRIDSFPAGREINLPYGPILSIVSVAYIDREGTTQTFTDYALDETGERIVLDHGATWPVHRAVKGAITITYTAGYVVVPEPLRTAIKFLVEIFYDRPDAGYARTLQFSADALMNYYRDYRNYWDDV